MNSATALCFGPFRLAGPRGPLWREGNEIPLRAKTLEVLWYLACHSGEVVDHDRLMAAVWPNRVVGVGTLAVSVSELRGVLGDDPKSPVYIQTLQRRGYRFIVPAHHSDPGEQTSTGSAIPLLLGRQVELRELQDWYLSVCRGRRLILFVTGEAGIGKSTLVNAWVDSLRRRDSILLGRGQCVEHSGAGEAYLAILEALSRLCRGPRGDRVTDHLRQHAPGWLAQLSGVLTASEREAIQQLQAPVGSHHYQLDLANALEALGATLPLVLVLEDLQWADQATIEALAVLARRPESARLLVIATCRPIGSTAPEHPVKALKQELLWHGQSQELALRGLDEDAVRTYVAEHVPPEAAASMAALVYQRTAGQPLFMVKLAQYLAEHPVLAEAGKSNALDKAAANLPVDLQQFIEVQLERLGATEQQVLEAASVVGPVFAAAAVAPALDLSEVAVEALCDRLARRDQLISAQGPVQWPDGTLSETYAFRHALYQEVLYARIGSGRRIHLHRAIGERLEAGHKGAASALAVELAQHFEQGQDDRRAVLYHRLAGETAMTRFAGETARAHLRRALMLLDRWPQDPKRWRAELELQNALGGASIATDGFSSPSAAYAYGRAHALCRQFPNTPTLLPVLCGLWNYFVTRADFRQARSLAQELAITIEHSGTSECLLPAHNAVGQTALFTGAPVRALVHIETERKALDIPTRQNLVAQYGEDPVVVREMYAALAHWLLGSPEEARRRIEAGLRLAHGLAQPFGIAQMLWANMLVARGSGDPAGVKSLAERLIELCEQEHINIWLGGGRILRGWALTKLGEPAAGIVAMRTGLEEWSAAGAALIRPYYLALLAEVYGKAGRLSDALATVGEALETVKSTGECWYEAELHRIRGELIVQLDVAAIDEAETAVCRALAIAREQQARALEVRAATSLARLWRNRGRQQDADRLLASFSGDIRGDRHQEDAQGVSIQQ
jgi:DNA-binding winged helix-turn-helix (wHTH) protein/predicted ATPase